MNISRRELTLGLVAAAAAAGFPAPDATQSQMVVNVTIKPMAVSWAAIYRELKMVWEEIYCQSLISGSAWDALLQIQAEALYRIECLAISHSGGKDKLYEFIGEEPFKANKRIAQCA